jgi:hypothetical protein
MPAFASMQGGMEQCHQQDRSQNALEQSLKKNLQGGPNCPVCQASFLAGSLLQTDPPELVLLATALIWRIEILAVSAPVNPFYRRQQARAPPTLV